MNMKNLCQTFTREHIFNQLSGVKNKRGMYEYIRQVNICNVHLLQKDGTIN